MATKTPPQTPTVTDEALAPVDVDGDEHFIELGHIPPMRTYLKEIWGRREFAVTVPVNDIRVQNMDTVLGQFWHVLNPALNIAVYYLIFGILISRVSTGVSNYLGFLMIGIIFYSLIQRITTDSVNAINRDEGLIRSIQFPRALLPIQAVIGQTVAFIPALVVLFAGVLLTGSPLSWRWPVIIPVVVLTTAINLGLSLFAARGGYAMRDLNQIVTHIFRILFYLSAVLFDVKAILQQKVDDNDGSVQLDQEQADTLLQLFALNPIYDVLTLARWCLLGTEAPLEVIVGALVYAIVLPVGGIMFFRKAEHRYGS